MITTKYINGNTNVTILSDGTKIREYEGIPDIWHPESIDVKITDYCDMGCSFCFLPDSEVLTINGNIQINNLKINDRVYSRDLVSGTNEIKRVTNIMERYIDEIIYVFELENGKTIKCTGNHEIFTENRGYIRANEISEMDTLSNIF